MVKLINDIVSQTNLLALNATIEAAREAVEAIRSITATIAEVRTISNTIASAVEEQGAATKEIARNVDQAATETTEVSKDITTVAAAELPRQPETLQQEVDNFTSPAFGPRERYRLGKAGIPSVREPADGNVRPPGRNLANKNAPFCGRVV